VRNTDDDILAALGVGGDDYVTKPFAMAVLLAKAQAVLKRNAKASAAARQMPGQMPGHIIRFGNVELDRSNGRVTRNGALVKLKPLELKLLLYLIDKKGSLASKDELLEKLWGGVHIGEGTLSVHIRHLREKLEEKPDSPRFIKTVWGSGYIFEGPCL
jgi:two-component system response regulator RegX3